MPVEVPPFNAEVPGAAALSNCMKSFLVVDRRSRYDCLSTLYFKA